MEYKKTDRALYSIQSQIGSINPHPANLESERKKVFQNRLYNPVFKYLRRVDNYGRLKQDLLDLRFDSSNLGKLFREKAKELLLKIRLIESLGTGSFTANSLELYGRPQKELVSRAMKFLKEAKYDKKDIDSYSGVGAVKKFIDIFMTKGLHWKVESRSMAVKAAINPGKKGLYFNKDRKFSELGIKKKKVHHTG